MSLTRTQWMSENARSVWEPRLKSVERAWYQAEVESVVAGVRSACYMDVPAMEYREPIAELRRRGLAAVIASLYTSGQGYSARMDVSGTPTHCRLAVANDYDTAYELARATDDGDDEVIGLLLGYPECCRRSFRSWWGERTEPPIDGHEGALVAANLFLRWIGVRPVPHLPCRMDCGATVSLFVKMGLILPEPEHSWRLDALKWPTLYTARNGIAVVETPVLRIVGEADPGMRRVELPGSSWPLEGALGVEFPLRAPKGCRPRASDGPMSREHDVNGFGSLEAMLEAHEAVLKAMPDSCAGATRVVDLGCGSGRLATLVAGRLAIKASGCDTSDDAVAWVRRAYPQGVWWTGDADSYSPMPGDLILTTPERLPSETGREAALWLYQYHGEGGFTDGPEAARLEAA